MGKARKNLAVHLRALPLSAVAQLARQKVASRRYAKNLQIACRFPTGPFDA
jgi:hypothetical protein